MVIEQKQRPLKLRNYANEKVLKIFRLQLKFVVEGRGRVS